MGKERIILFVLLIFIFSAGQITASDPFNASISANNSTTLDTNGSLYDFSIQKSANEMIYVNNSTGPVADYTSIQDAVNNSKDGDSIIVYEGVYEEQIMIDRELKILAKPGETVPAIRCDFGENYTYNELANSIFLVRSNNVTISGFSITAEGYQYTTGIYLLGAENCSVVNNTLTSCGYGIYLDDSSNNSLEKNSIIPTSEKFFPQGTGIYFRQSSGNSVTDNKISRCQEGIEFTKNSNRNKVLNCEINVTGYDIKLVSSKENRITGNSITGTSSSTVLQSSLNNVIENNTLKGLKLSDSHENYIFNNSNCELELFDSDSNELIGNNFSFCSTYGVYLSRSDKNIIRDNSVNHNNVFPDEYIHEDHFYEQDPLGLSGIYLSKSHHNILENNSASYNLFNGIRLDDSDYNLFANNTIESNNEAGLLLHNCSQNKVYHNEIKGNKYGIKTESTLSFKEGKTLENIIEENIFENNERNVAKSYFELPKFRINDIMVILIIVGGLILYSLLGLLIILVSIFAGILIYDKVKKRKSE